MDSQKRVLSSTGGADGTDFFASRKDSWKMESGKLSTSIITIPGSAGARIFDGRSPVSGRLEYVPSKLVTDVDLWNIDYLQITDQRGHT